MQKWRVALHVDGMVYLTVTAEDEDAAKIAALDCVPDGDFVEVVWTQRAEG